MNLKVSILIPVYNSAAFLAETIQSALDQTWKDIEIIIVDDGSTDDSFSIALEYADVNVRIFRQQKGGACKARNLAFEKSTGDYIQYLDADDLLSPGKIEEQLRCLPDNSLNTVISCKWVKFQNHQDAGRSNNSPLFRDYADAKDLLVDMWEKQRMMQTSVWLTPRHLIEKSGGWNEDLLINQDGEFFCRVLVTAESVKFSKYGTVYYREGIVNSISKAPITWSRASSLLKSYQSYEFQMTHFMNSIRVRTAISNNYYSFIYQYYHKFYDLVKEAEKAVELLDVPPPRNIGGSGFTRLQSLVGFYKALKIAKFFRR